MRVVAGLAGGRRLQAPAGRKVRPTSERVREALFNALGSMDAIAGASVLDLFAGSGALGIEALSRGAASATFVEADARAVAAVKANLLATGLGERARVVQSDVVRFLSHPPPAPVDLAFADPPYAFSGWADVLDRLPAALVAVEARSHLDLGPAWRPVRSKRYGDTVIILARRVGPAVS
ncbi:MAG: 16S rRNA (guanine(966)-N(2))-methyltransferase RsmD [Acidimicrobiales bacterium]